MSWHGVFLCWKRPIFSSSSSSSCVTGIRCYLRTLCLIDRNTERAERCLSWLLFPQEVRFVGLPAESHCKKPSTSTSRQPLKPAGFSPFLLCDICMMSKPWRRTRLPVEIVIIGAAFLEQSRCEHWMRAPTREDIEMKWRFSLKGCVLIEIHSFS